MSKLFDCKATIGSMDRFAIRLLALSEFFSTNDQLSAKNFN